MIRTPLRLFFLLSGHLFVGLAVVGIFLPVIPTTPFILLASACYAKSSKRFHVLLRTNRWFGRVVENWEREKSISLQAKTLAISMIALGIGASLFYVPLLAIKITLIAIGASVSLYIATRPLPRNLPNKIAARP